MALLPRYWKRVVDGDTFYFELHQLSSLLPDQDVVYIFVSPQGFLSESCRYKDLHALGFESLTRAEWREAGMQPNLAYERAMDEERL